MIVLLVVLLIVLLLPLIIVEVASLFFSTGKIVLRPLNPNPAPARQPLNTRLRRRLARWI